MAGDFRSLDEIHNACLAELSLPKSVRLTVEQDLLLRARLIYIMKHGGTDPVVAARLFREAMDGV